MTPSSVTVAPRPRAGRTGRAGRAVAMLVATWLVAGCSTMHVPTPAPEASAGTAVATLSPAAAAVPKLRVRIAGRDLLLAGYDPAWPSTFASDREAILRLAPRIQLQRGTTYPIEMSLQAVDPVEGWLPPDFGLIGGSAPVRTSDGFVADRPGEAFVRADALPDLEAGLFGVKVAGDGGSQIYAYPVWVEEPDVMAPDALAGLLVGISDEDGAAAAQAFIAHLEDDLRRGGGPEPVFYPSKADLLAAFDAGDVDAYISIPAGWSDHPTTRNGFEFRSQDPVSGNGATDTGDSYTLASLVTRALGPAGLIINRGY